MSHDTYLEIKSHKESCFYELDSRADPIMTLSNFPDDILSLLQMESLMTFEAMIYFRCDVLVELGCYDGRALEIARQLNTRYLGIDLNRRAIELLQERIRREGMKDRADAIVDDILNHGSGGHIRPDARALYLSPFNLTGNFRDPARLLKPLGQRNVAAVVCVFGDSFEATRVRQDYYQKSGVKDLQLHSLADGVVFTGTDGFYSRSYNRSSFLSLLSRCGHKIVHVKSNSIAHCATVQLNVDAME